MGSVWQKANINMLRVKSSYDIIQKTPSKQNGECVSQRGHLQDPKLTYSHFRH